jgi:hypothetical protein
VSEKGGGARYAAQWLRDMADPHPSSKPTFDLVVTGSMWSARIVTSYLRQQRALALAPSGGWPAPLVKVVPPGIDLGIFNTNPAGALGSLGVAATARTSLGEDLSLEGRFVVYSAGALGPRMGADILMAAWAEFADRHPQALLLVAWHGAEPYSASQALSACEPRLAALPVATPQLRQELEGGEGEILQGAWSRRCAVKCGAARRGAVRCGAVRCGAVRCGAAWWVWCVNDNLQQATVCSAPCSPPFACPRP